MTTQPLATFTRVQVPPLRTWVCKASPAFRDLATRLHDNPKLNHFDNAAGYEEAVLQAVHPLDRTLAQWEIIAIALYFAAHEKPLRIDDRDTFERVEAVVDAKGKVQYGSPTVQRIQANRNKRRAELRAHGRSATRYLTFNDLAMIATDLHNESPALSALELIQAAYEVSAVDTQLRQTSKDPVTEATAEFQKLQVSRPALPSSAATATATTTAASTGAASAAGHLHRCK